MRLSRKIALLVSAAIVLSLLPRPAFACSCAPPGTPLETLEGATAVFVGEVVSVEAPEPVDGAISTADPVKVTFAVNTVWKGQVQPELTLTTPRMDASCGYTFVIGQTYLVYAYGHSTSLETHLCTRNQPIADAADDLLALGEGSEPSTPIPGTEPETPGPGSEPPAPGWDNGPAIATALVVAAAAAAVGIILYRRK